LKILLVGEYSGLHKYLQKGVIERGHKCIFASYGDGWKKVESDINFASNLPGLIGKVHHRIKPFQYLYYLTGYDIVQFMTSEIFDTRLGLNKIFINFLIKNNYKSVLLSAGCSPLFFKNIKLSNLKDHPCDSCMKYDLKSICDFSSINKLQWNKVLANKVDAIIPSFYSYEFIYKGFKNLQRIIPLPIDLTSIQYKQNKVKNKIVFLHGINRAGFKGSHYIISALENMKKKYPSEINIKIVRQLPLKKYLEILNETNVLIDQTYGYGLGLNSLQTMALGKVLLTNFEKKLFNNDLPVFQIIPDNRQIENQIAVIIENRNKIENIGYRARKYVEKYHDCRKIADQYIKIWSKL